MGHFANVKDGIVTQVIVAEQDFIDTMPDDGSVWIRTSYWTRGGIHYGSDGLPSQDQSKALRKNYAGIGFTYDEKYDAFIPPYPGEAYELNTETFLWEPRKISLKKQGTR